MLGELIFYGKIMTTRWGIARLLGFHGLIVRVYAK
jgi:hypothetical protein